MRGKEASAVLGLLALVIPGTNAATTLSQCCSLLSQLYPENIFIQSSSTYDYENHHFWSATEVLDPRCVFLPDTIQKVADAVALFAEHECQFAIKGGGHSAIPGAANIHDGILMPMERIDTLEVNFADDYIRVGAGATLGSVYAALDPHNKSAVIGRYRKVGLGLALGAGFSYFSNRDGLAIDNVLRYEVVLANGTVVLADLDNHPDLFWALKGGNNNFGVVTHFNLRIFDTPGRVLGGLMYYPESSLDELADVIYDHHVHQAVDDVLTHTLPQYGFDGATNTTINFSPVVYNADVHELPEIMQGWNATPHYKSTVHNRVYTDLANELNDGFPDGQFQVQRIMTVYADRDLYKDIWWEYRKWMQKYRDVPGFYGLHCNMPITPRQIEQGMLRGGNALGLEGAGNQTLGVLYFGVTLTAESDVQRVFEAHDEFVQNMQKLAKSRGLLHPYLMLPYSGWNQPVIQSYGKERLSKLWQVQKAYDPTHVFQRLVPGGQKLPSPGEVSFVEAANEFQQGLMQSLLQFPAEFVLPLGSLTSLYQRMKACLVSR
ncbi:conserved hypothetical protein [Talaromyces stipitatus ATCC 10500]|uniref:FAD-binding PCMH-type domain-containing protein n=1 Tax=Talaromyces stipitatus (strain ATCC 10500 / CBS 375.48 / QM 6759 / NRRL 1006) TaxID=441959 RepID=B8MPS7_TALSN|nr:uncharacterized protein TSTA_052560 [Talaromyces stipitatus ATCC 10500]EED12735.1 conserved hypothetical protein [Talaromyces stipitatus ATCC 10500]